MIGNQQSSEETIYVVDIIPGVVGWIIGRAGARIKEIQAKTHCKMWVDQDVSDDQPRKLFFQGTKQSIEIAVAIIDQLLAEAPLLGGKHGDVRHLTSKILDCPAQHIGLVIGKKGCTITRIQAESGAQIAINQSVEDDQPKKIIISGDEYSVNKAVALITETMRTKIHQQPVEDHSSFKGIYGNTARERALQNQALINNLRLNRNMPAQSFNKYSDEELEVISRILGSRDINPATYHSAIPKRMHHVRRADSDLTSTESSDSAPSMSHFRAVDSTRKVQFPHGNPHNPNYEYRRSSSAPQYAGSYNSRSSITADDYQEWMLMRGETNNYPDVALSSHSVNKMTSHPHNITSSGIPNSNYDALSSFPIQLNYHPQQGNGRGNDGMTSSLLNNGSGGGGGGVSGSSSYQSLMTFRNNSSRLHTANQFNTTQLNHNNVKKYLEDDEDSYDMLLASATHSLANTNISNPVNNSSSSSSFSPPRHHQVVPVVLSSLQQDQTSYKNVPQQLQVMQPSSTGTTMDDVTTAAPVGSYAHCINNNNIIDGTSLFQYCV